MTKMEMSTYTYNDVYFAATLLHGRGVSRGRAAYRLVRSGFCRFDVDAAIRALYDAHITDTPE